MSTQRDQLQDQLLLLTRAVSHFDGDAVKHVKLRPLSCPDSPHFIPVLCFLLLFPSVSKEQTSWDQVFILITVCMTSAR